MCLAAVTPACQCRQFRPLRDDTARLLVALRHPDQFVRIGAVARLRGRPEAEEVLLAALGDDSFLVRREAVRALEDVSRPAVRRALIGIVAEDPSRDVREQAVAVLADFLQRSGVSTGR
jgi:HEAT repeat protein